MRSYLIVNGQHSLVFVGSKADFVRVHSRPCVVTRLGHVTSQVVEVLHKLGSLNV